MRPGAGDCGPGIEPGPVDLCAVSVAGDGRLAGGHRPGGDDGEAAVPLVGR
jgi:hypothetical protein